MIVKKRLTPIAVVAAGVKAVQSASPSNKFSLDSATNVLNRNGHSVAAGVILYGSKTGSLRTSAAADYLVKHHRFTLTF